MQDIKLPEIGEGVTEGELIKWLVKEGDPIKIDQPLAEILTDKASVEIPSSVIGTVKSLKAQAGDMIKVGQVMMKIKESQQSSPQASSQQAKMSKEKVGPQQEDQSSQITTSTYTQELPISHSLQALATPSTRRLAVQLGVDISQISGTGNVGRVTREDVEKFAALSSQSKSLLKKTDIEDEVIPLRGIRKKIAENMQKSKQKIPHFSLMDEANVTELVQLRTKCKKHFKDIKITYLPFIMKALICACRKFPMLNACIDQDKIIYKKNFHIGFAAETPDGLLVPVVKDADQKTILQISQEIKSLANKAKAGQLSLDEMTGGTITITNIGSIGGTYATPIINPSEVAIIGLYRIQKRPIFDKDENLQSADIMNLSCTADHRLIDGAVAARFLRALIEKIETPSLLMVDLT